MGLDVLSLFEQGGAVELRAEGQEDIAGLTAAAWRGVEVVNLYEFVATRAQFLVQLVAGHIFEGVAGAVMGAACRDAVGPFVYREAVLPGEDYVAIRRNGHYFDSQGAVEVTEV